MKLLQINTHPAYPVKIGSGLLDTAGSEIKKTGSRKVALIADENTFGLFGNRVVASLENAGLSYCVKVIAAGENSKSHETLVDVYDFLFENRITRSDLVAALGGGVVGDLAGFAAATYLRGVGLIQLPTTLLAMTDSSVGGKTAINLRGGKNQVGAFYQPEFVLCDTDALTSLPLAERLCGMGECVKYAAIMDASLADILTDKDKTEEIIYRCLKIKAYAVENDTFDKGVRQMLNFGHTLAHGIEKLSDYAVPHGTAVAQGMYLMTALTVKNGLTPQSALQKLELVLQKCGLDYRTSYPLAEIKRVALSDKKRKGDKITVVYLEDFGRYSLKELSVTEFTEGGAWTL